MANIVPLAASEHTHPDRVPLVNLTSLADCSEHVADAYGLLGCHLAYLTGEARGDIADPQYFPFFWTEDFEDVDYDPVTSDLPHLPIYLYTHPARPSFVPALPDAMTILAYMSCTLADLTEPEHLRHFGRAWLLALDRGSSQLHGPDAYDPLPHTFDHIGHAYDLFSTYDPEA